MSKGNNQCFPKHLAFYQLAFCNDDEAFYHNSDNRLEVRYANNKAVISEYFGETLFKITVANDLQKGVFRHFHDFASLNSPAFERWRSLVKTNPFVQVDSFAINGTGYLFFPAVFLFLIRVPVLTEETRLRLEKFLWYNGLYKKKWHTYQTTLVKNEEDVCTEQQIWMFDMSASQQEVFSLCNAVTLYGNREKDCPIPIIVQEYNAAALCRERVFHYNNQQYEVVYQSKN